MPGAAHPLILAHRGASASARENTLEAFRLAVAQDADGIELDVRLTGDDVLVIHHDPSIDGVGDLVETTFDRLRTAAPWVPTLDEALSVTGDLLLDLEVKNDPAEPDHDPDQVVARRVARWVEGHDLQRRAVVTSLDPAAVDAAREASSVPTGLLLAPSASIATGLERAGTAGHRWLLPHWSSLTGDATGIIAAAHRNGLAIVSWTVDDTELMRSLADAGIDGIITNDPAAATTALTG